MEMFQSNILSKKTLLRALNALPAFFRTKLGDSIITAYYEIGCNLHMELCYRPMSVGTRWINRFIRDSLDHQIVIPGRSDFRFVVPEDRLNILFCHEGDIHISGNDEELMRDLLATKPFKEFEFIESREDTSN